MSDKPNDGGPAFPVECVSIDLEAIRKRAEAATEGPWKTHLVDDTSIVTEDGTDVCTTCDSSQAEREDGYNVEYERMEADADFIAHARTDIPALLSHIAALESLINKYGQAILDVADAADDEGDRAYFGSTNDLDRLKELREEYFQWRFVSPHLAQKEPMKP